MQNAERAILHSTFCLLPSPAGGLGVALGWLSVGYQHALRSHSWRFRWLGPADRLHFCFLRSALCFSHVRPFEVQGSRVGSHKHSESNPLALAASGWSGGGLVLPWYCPGTIDHARRPVFNQPALSKCHLLRLLALKRPGLETLASSLAYASSGLLSPSPGRFMTCVWIWVAATPGCLSPWPNPILGVCTPYPRAG